MQPFLLIFGQVAEQSAVFFLIRVQPLMSLGIIVIIARPLTFNMKRIYTYNKKTKCIKREWQVKYSQSPYHKTLGVEANC